MNTLSTVVLAPALLAFGSILIAQQPVPAAAPDIQALGRGHGLQADADGLLGLGADHVVRFDRAGMQFTPVQGRHATPCAPLQVSLRSIHRGKQPLACELGVPPTQVGDVATYRRAAGIRECYEVQDRGVEQYFVFDTLPGQGDLVVRCRLDGLGAGAVPAADGGLEFWHAGRRVARLGGVVGIDARGERATGTLRLMGDELELSLPGTFVDHAALPLVLDPFIGSMVTPGPGTTFDVAPDVAFDPVQQHWVFVWERNVSQAQSDILRRSWSPTSGLGTLTVMASANGQYNQGPKIAFHTGIDRFLVVFQQQAFALGAASVVGMTLNSNGAQGGQVAMGAAAAGSNTEPDVSGDPTGAGVGIVCYEIHGVNSGIRYRPYTLGATGDPVLGTQVSVTTNATAVRPRVSKSAGAQLAIVFEMQPLAYAGVFIQALTRSGALQASPFGVFNTSGPHLRRPEVDGDGTRFLMVYESERAAGDRDVQCYEWTWNGSAFGPPTGSATISGLAGVDEAAPTVAFLGQKYVVAWEHQTGFLTGTVRCRTFAPGGCVPCGPLLAAATSGTHVQPALASDLASGGPGTTALLACTASTATLPATADIVAFRWDTHVPTTPATQGSGCGHPTTLQLLSDAGIGNTAFGLRTTTTDPLASLAVFALAFGFSTPLSPCGSCLLVSPLTAEFRPLTGGSASYTLPIPCETGFIGLPLRAQAVLFGSTQNVCPAAAQLSASPTLGITIGD